MHLILVIRLQILLLVIESLHVLRNFSVLLGRSNYIFFELRRKSLNLLYIYVVVRIVVVVSNLVPLVEYVVLLFLWILVAQNLPVSNLTWQNFLVSKLLVIGLNDESISWRLGLESWTRGIQAIAAMNRAVVIVIEYTHLVPYVIVQ